MTIEAVKIPANIQVEEKIIGPIGLRQIFILIGCGGLSYFFWTMVKDANGGSFLQIAAWSPLVVGAAFAFIKINDVSLLRLLLLGIETFYKPTKRTFGPRQGITINIRTRPVDEKKKTEAKAEAPKEHLEKLSTVLDTSLEALEKQEAEEIGEPSVDNIHASEKENLEEKPNTIVRDIHPPTT